MTGASAASASAGASTPRPDQRPVEPAQSCFEVARDSLALDEVLEPPEFPGISKQVDRVDRREGVPIVVPQHLQERRVGVQNLARGDHYEEPYRHSLE